MFKILKSIYPGVDEEMPEEAQEPGEVESDEADYDDIVVDDDVEVDEPAPRRAARVDRGPSERETKAEARANRMEEEMAEMRRERKGPSQSELARQDDDRRLNDPNTDEMTKWQINANRTLRDTQAQATEAYNQAKDMRDQAKFLAKSADDPRRAKYADRIEAELLKVRASGRDVDRETVYFYQLGKDIAEGKLKPAAKKVSKAAEVPRGKPSAARSDVRSSGRTKSASGARERLADRNI